jgi:pimeloyl-ACP methyl ester carboxylesterase
MREKPPIAIRRVIVLVHGIRTTGSWEEMVVHELAGLSNTVTIPLRYGYFDVIRFLVPELLRRTPIQRIARELRAIQKRFKEAKISVIAHSFGTYLISKVIAEESDIELEYLLLCGSVIPTDFRWDLVRPRLVQQPVNDCGTKDLWPVLATVTWGYGPSGTLGCGSAEVIDRFHPFKHSDFFNAQFVREYWRPIFEANEIHHSPYEITRPAVKWWWGLLVAYPLRYAITLSLAVVLGLFSVGWYGNYKTTHQGEHILDKLLRAKDPVAANNVLDNVEARLSVGDHLQYEQIAIELGETIASYKKQPPLDGPDADYRDVRRRLTSLLRRTATQPLYKYLPKDAFKDANLELFDLSNAELMQFNFDESFLLWTDLKGSYLQGSSFINTDVQGAEFAGANLDDATFSNVDWYNAFSFDVMTLSREQLRSLGVCPKDIDGFKREFDHEYELHVENRPDKARFYSRWQSILVPAGDCEFVAGAHKPS